MERMFDNLPQRSVYAFLGTYPPFAPIEPNELTTEEQRRANLFIKGIYTALFDDPTLIGLKITPDEAYEGWALQKTNPDIAAKVRKNTAKIESFIALVFDIVRLGEIEGNGVFLSKEKFAVKPAARKQLAAFGVGVEARGDGQFAMFPEGVVGGLKLLADISAGDAARPQLLFSRGVFDPRRAWTQEVFANLSGGAAFDRLCAFFEDGGYLRIDNSPISRGISLNYVKNFGKPGDPIKLAWSERAHSGIEVVYDETRKNLISVTMRIPHFADLLRNSSIMSPQVRDFVIERGKKCDDCRFCVQTDKTGTRPVASIDVDGHAICPLFNGFYFRFNAVDDALTDNIIALLRFIEDIFRDRLTEI